MEEMGGSLGASHYEFSDLFGGGDMPGTVTIGLASGRLSLTQQDLRSLTWDQHTHIWRVRSAACTIWELQARWLWAWGHHETRAQDAQPADIHHIAQHITLTSWLLPSIAQPQVRTVPGISGVLGGAGSGGADAAAAGAGRAHPGPRAAGGDRGAHPGTLPCSASRSRSSQAACCRSMRDAALRLPAPLLIGQHLLR